MLPVLNNDSDLI